MYKIALIEIGGSHDECLLSQVVALKNAGCYVAFCGSKKMMDRNLKFHEYFDEFKEIVFPKKSLGDFNVMRNLSKWLVSQGFHCLVANTAQGGHIRNLCLTASRKMLFLGIVHTTKMFEGSFTQNLISRKIKNYFVLNDSLLEKIDLKSRHLRGISVRSFYPLTYPRFNETIEKPENEFWVGILGEVENRRKDLSQFNDLVKSSPENVKFVFLGKSNFSKDDVRVFYSKLEKDSLLERVVIFDDFIDQIGFDSYLSKMDCIMPLVHPGTISATEFFNRQISGAINAAFSYKIPLVIHDNYRTWPDFDQGVYFYNNETFLNCLRAAMKQKATLVSEMEKHEKFDCVKQENRFANCVIELLNKQFNLVI